MADRIKGITVEIGGDTTDLNSALSDVNTQSRNLQRELNDVQRLLRFDPSNTELMAQRQQLLNRQVENTTDRLNRLRSVSEQVERQFAAGDIGEDAFRGFQREIQATQGRLQRLQREMQDTGREAQSLKDVMKDAGAGMANALAGAVAGAGAGAIIGEALSQASLDTTIDISFNVPEEAKAEVKNAVHAVTAYGIDAESALNGVRKQWQLNANLTAEENQKIVDGAAAISRAYGDIDFNELIQETNEMAKGMGMSQDEALGMTKALLDMGFPPDQLDIISEYGQQLSRAGYNAGEIQNIFAAGIETGTWNIDVLLDGLKEGRIKAAEFGQGINQATKDAIAGTDISAAKLQEWGKAAAGGGDAGKKAMGEMAKAVMSIEDPVKRNQVGTQLFGTLWEENGEKVAIALAGAETGTADLKTNQDNLNKSVSEMKADPQVKLNEALQTLRDTLQPLLAIVADWVAKVADWVSKNPELAAGITAVVIGIGLLIAVCMALAPAFMLLSAAATALNIGMLPLTAIILGIILVIGLLVAAGIYLYKHWDELMAKARELGATIAAKFNEMKEKAAAKMREIREKVSEIWGKVMDFFHNIDLAETGKNIIRGLIKGIGSMAKEVWNKAKEIANGIGKAISNALKEKSPSRVTMKMGENAGEGLAVGLMNTVGKVQSMSTRLADTVANSISGSLDESQSALTLYFEAIRQDGDWLNDWLTHMPKEVANLAQQMGKALAPSFEGADTAAEIRAAAQKALTVNLYSPKALDVREASKEFNRTLNKMSLMW